MQNDYKMSQNFNQLQLMYAYRLGMKWFTFDRWHRLSNGHYHLFSIQMPMYHTCNVEHTGVSEIISVDVYVYIIECSQLKCFNFCCGICPAFPSSDRYSKKLPEDSLINVPS